MKRLTHSASLAWLLTLVSSAGIAQSQFVMPEFVRPMPIYFDDPNRTPEIFVECVFPASAIPAYVKYNRWLGPATGTPDHTATVWTDFYHDTTGIQQGVEYSYTCGECVGDEEGAACGPMSQPFTTTFDVVWPVKSVTGAGEGETVVNHYDVLDGFNEVIGWGTSQIARDPFAAISTGYHDGLDLNAPYDPSKQPRVVAARSGKIATETISQDAPGRDNGRVVIAVIVGLTELNRPIYNHDFYNHVATVGRGGSAPSLPTGVIETRPVRAGQHIAQVGRERFPGVLDDHIHFSITDVPETSSVSLYNPLEVFWDFRHRDPNVTPPGFSDENDDGKFALFREHVSQTDTEAAGFHYGPSLFWIDNEPPPLYGDIDIAVEVVDNQGTRPMVAPRRLGYWIKGPRPDDEDQDDVKNALDPYVLFDFDKHYFGGEVKQGWTQADGTPCHWVADISDEANAGCQMGGLITKCTETLASQGSLLCSTPDIQDTTTNPPSNYLAPVLHHFIVTHAAGLEGRPEDVSIDEFWRTNARDDGRPSSTANANYSQADPIAIKATEARFPDGEYELHVKVRDLGHTGLDDEGNDLVVPRSPTRRDEPLLMRLENFAPIIEEVDIRQDADNEPAGAQGGVEMCERPLYEYDYAGPRNPYPGRSHLSASRRQRIDFAGGCRICVRVRFSEGMDSASGQSSFELVPEGIGDQTLPLVLSSWDKAYSTDDEWTGVFILSCREDGMAIGTEAEESLTGLSLRVRAHDVEVVRRGWPEPRARGLDIADNGIGRLDAVDIHHRYSLDEMPPSSRHTYRLERSR